MDDGAKNGSTFRPPVSSVIQTGCSTSHWTSSIINTNSRRTNAHGKLTIDWYHTLLVELTYGKVLCRISYDLNTGERFYSQCSVMILKQFQSTEALSRDARKMAHLYCRSKSLSYSPIGNTFSTFICLIFVPLGARRRGRQREALMPGGVIGGWPKILNSFLFSFFFFLKFRRPSSVNFGRRMMKPGTFTAEPLSRGIS